MDRDCRRALLQERWLLQFLFDVETRRREEQLAPHVLVPVPRWRDCHTGDICCQIINAHGQDFRPRATHFEITEPSWHVRTPSNETLMALTGLILIQAQAVWRRSREHLP